MNHTNRLTRAALVSAIALCFGAPAYATDNAPIVVAQASGQGGSNSMQPGGAGANAHGTSGNTAGQPGPSTSGSAMGSGSAVTSGPAKGSNSTNNARGAADNTNSRARSGDVGDMNAWMTRHARDHQGRISRQAYMDEMGRRWDSLDRNSQGLTPAEVSRLTGKVDVDHSAPARTGSGAQAGNMGPSSTKGN